MDLGLPAGVYEALHTHALDKALGAAHHATPHFNKVEPAEAPEVLARHVAGAVRRALLEAPHDQRLEKINGLLALVADDSDAVVALEQLIASRSPRHPECTAWCDLRRRCRTSHCSPIPVVSLRWARNCAQS